MSDPLEDRLRAHFAGRAAQVRADPNPGALMERTVGRSGRRVLVGVAALAVVLAGSAALAGAELAGGGSSGSASSAARPSATVPSTTALGGAGASVAPSAAGDPNQPVTTSPTPETLLFTRTTASGVTIRSYGTEFTAIENCTGAAACPPPPVTPQGQGGSTGTATAGGSGASSSAGSVGGATGAVPPGTDGSTTTTTTPTTTTPSTTSTTATATTAPTTTTTTSVSSQPTVECGSLVVELSTASAVGTGSVPRPTVAASRADEVEILGSGSFGVAEGAPVGWVAVWVGPGVTSVTLTEGGATDSMAPESGLAVLALPGDAALTGATVVGDDQSGAAVSTVPLAQAPVTVNPDGCGVLPITSPPTTVPAPSSTPAQVPSTSPAS